MSGRKVVPEVLKRDSRARRFGIDCASELRWHAKDPGGDYKQTLILKNVSNQVIKFKFKLPETSFFFMKFPDLVTLSPGMASKVDVSFRPIEKAVYDDVVEFITSSGSFFIRVVATLKEQGLKVQEYLDFGFATVKEESHRQFVLKNVGEVDSPFELLAEPPFSVEPVSGVCKVGTSVPINLTFFPTEASVFVGTVVVKQPEGASLVMKVSGIGKLPFLNVSEHLLDFGNVLLGQSMTLELIISNQSIVPVSYDLIPVPTDNDPAFKWSATSGKLPADSSVALIVKYTPLATGAFDCEYFDIVTPAGGIQKICCKGYAQPHDVQLAVTSINFGNLVLGKTSMRTVEIINQTNAQAFYQFVTEPSGCFEFSRTDGTIIPESTSNVDIRFKARTVGNFYRRIFILVKNQGPLYLDLTATAYHQDQDQVPRPMPLFQKHVDAWRRRQLAERTSHALAILESENKGDPVAEVWNEFFLDDVDSRRQVFLQEQDIEFGAPAGTGIGEYKTMTLCNNTGVKMTAMFVIPPDGYQTQPEGAGEIKMTTLGPVLQPMETCFKVFPEKADILPHNSTTFKVAFRPVYDNAYYSQSLEVFMYPKTQRNFRLVTDDNFYPPLCVTPVCSGNTFPPGMEAYTPKLRVPTTRINFPACSVNDNAYQVVEMYNDADTPMRFQIDQDETGVFRSKPYNGLIMPHCVQLVAFRFRPTEAERYERVFTCLMNGNEAHSVAFTLVGTGNNSAIQLETQHLQIKPTWMGAVSTRCCDVRNPGGVPVFFNWHIPQAYERVIKIEPQSGILRGNETKSLFWHFAPKKQGAYSMRIPCTVERAQVKSLGDTMLVGDEADAMLTMGDSSAGLHLTKKQQRAFINIHGVGSGGILEFEPQVVDFGTLLVGNEVSRVIKLINNSDSTMFFDMQSNMPDNINFQDGHGVLPAYSTKRVTVGFTPAARVYYNVLLHAILSRASEAAETGTYGGHTGEALKLDLEADQMPQCQVLGNAVYPTLSVMDVRSEGVSSSRLWRELDFIDMNTELSSDLTQTEIAWNKAEVDETDPSKVLKVVNVRFTIKPEGDSPSIVVLRVKNTGVLPLDYLLKYPRDDEDEPENWVDKDLQGIDEQTLNLILENKLFICEPRRGHLQVEEEVDIILSYKHTFAGTTFRLPVILNVCDLPPAGGVINTGKQIVMCLVGETIHQNESRLALPMADSRKYKEGEWGFQTVPIGLINPPVQYYTIMNTGTAALDYELDLSEMDAVNEESFGFDVFTCEDRSDGHLEPGESTTVGFIFNPLEPKMYEWDMMVTDIGKGERLMVHLYAEGVHQDPNTPLKTTVWPLPLYQVMPMPNQPVVMSYERLILGDIPVGAEIHRMIILRNTDQESYMEYAFDTGSKLASQYVTLSPPQGEIPPSDFVVVRCTVRCMVTSVLDFDIKCQIFPKRAEEEENEDLADEAPAQSGGGGTAGGKPGTGGTRPGSAQTARSSASAAGSARGGGGANKSRKRTSVLDLPPLPRGTMTYTGKAAKTSTGAKGNVTFNDGESRIGGDQTARSGTAMTKGFDDNASVRSGKTAVTQANASTVALGLAHNSEGSQPEIDYSLHVSIQAHARSAEIHERLFGDRNCYRFPKAYGPGSASQGSTLKASNVERISAATPVRPGGAMSVASGVGGAVASTAGSIKGGAAPKTAGTEGGADAVSGPPKMVRHGSMAASTTSSVAPGGAKGGEDRLARDSVKREVAGGVLEQMLNEVLGDEDVLGVLEDLEAVKVPTFVQLSARPPTPFRLSTADVGGDDAQKGTMVLAGVDVPGHSAEVLRVEDEEKAAERERDRMRRLAIATPEFENLAAFVVDSCLFNLIEECAFGEEPMPEVGIEEEILSLSTLGGPREEDMFEE